MQRARNITRSKVDAAANEAAPSVLNDLESPAEAQAKADNYKRGRVKLRGLGIRIDNPFGSTRSGKDEDGKDWSTKMVHHYGDVEGTVGADGDPIDMFIGPRPDLDTVFVIDQVNPKTGLFDESKAMAGFVDVEAAKAGYLANYEPGWKGLGEVTPMSSAEFRKWSLSDDAKRPDALYARRKGDADVRADDGRDPGNAGAGTSRPAGVADRERGEAAGPAGAESDGPVGVPDGAAAARGSADLGKGRAAEDQAAVDGLNRRQGSDIRLADPARADTRAVNNLLDAFARLTRQRGIAVEWDGKGATDGVAYNGRFFVNTIDVRQALAWTIGHEFKHVAERSKGAPALYQRIWDQFPQSARAEYLKYLRNTKQVSTDDITQATAGDMARLKDEMVADFMGQRFTDKVWLTKLSKLKPALFG